MSAISTARFSTSRRGYDGAEQRRRRTRWNHDPSLSRATTKEFNMTKLKTVAMIGALLLGGSAFALAQTSSTTTMSPSGTTAAPSNTMAPVTQPTDGSHPPMQTQTKGATTGSSSSTTTTAPGPQSAMRTDQDVVNRLQAAGYSDVTDVKQDKNGYTASALKNGKRIKVDIDSNGRIETMD
jgi:outer membrane biosynthesis protein TonB